MMRWLPRCRMFPILVLIIIFASFAVIQMSSGKSAPTSTAISAPVQEFRDWQAEQDERRMEEHLAAYGSGYDCDANSGVTNLKDLKLCPDYVATVVFADGKPVVTDTRMDGSVRPISITVEPFRSCGNDGVVGAPQKCADLWRIRWSVMAGYVALGFNQQMAAGVFLRTDINRNDIPNWVGPLGFGAANGEKLVGKETVAFEVYAGDPKAKTSPEPLSDDRQQPRI